MTVVNKSQHERKEFLGWKSGDSFSEFSGKTKSVTGSWQMEIKRAISFIFLPVRGGVCLYELVAFPYLRDCTL